MSDYILPLMGAAFGAAAALPLQHLYNVFPEAWLQDYDYDPTAGNHRAARRMTFIPHTLIVLISLGLLFFLAFFANKSFVSDRAVFHILLVLLPLLPFSIIVVSDQLNRIIPDQLVAAVAVFSIFGFLADSLEGNMWMSPHTAWYMYPVNRILGALIGAGLLWGIGILGSWISGQDSMGFGDVKLMFACGLLCGAYGLGFVFFFAFVLGGLFAIPLYIRKRQRIRAEEKMILTSENPDAAKKMLDDQKENVHFADDPDYIAFGPFLTLGTAVFLVFETPLYEFFRTQILASARMLF